MIGYKTVFFPIEGMDNQSVENDLVDSIIINKVQLSSG